MPQLMKSSGCLDDARELAKSRVCLEPVSKNAEGELRLVDREVEECSDPKCETLKTDHLLRLEVKSHKPCDSKVGKLLDGVFYVRKLVSALSDGNGERRGIHAGEFRWNGNGVRIEGRMSGMTNVGTHRAPVFDECQKCNSPGYMEGRLCGRIVKARDEKLVGCEVTAVYRFRFDHSKGFQDTGIAGTIEGAVVCECGGGDDGGGCLQLGGFPAGSHPNPWTIAGYEFHVFDWTGAPAATAEISGWGFGGLNANYSTHIELPSATTAVDITLVHYSSPATVTAYNAAGVAVDSAIMTVSNVPETLHLSGAGITRLIVNAPQNETLILEICPR